jgi:hypothetical protein
MTVLPVMSPVRSAREKWVEKHRTILW